MSVWRSRWAAAGAAVAVSLGAGGLFSVSASGEESVFVSVEPVRVLDTRIPLGSGGPLSAGTAVNLEVTGTIPVVGPGNVASVGTPVPVGASGVVLNVTVVRPTASAGFVSVRPGDATGVPTTSNLNFTSAGVVVPNAVTVQVPTSGAAAGELNLYLGGVPGSTAHLLIDVVGYYVAGGAGVPGPEGPPGPKGDQGDVGDTGPAGADGRDGAGADYWWYQDAAVNSNNPKELLGSDGATFDGSTMMLVFCWQPSLGGATTLVQAGEYFVQRDTNTPPNWIIELLTPTSTSQLFPELVVSNDKLFLTNGAPAGGWMYRCRFEGLG